MSKQQFFKNLIGISLSLALVVFALSFIPFFYPYQIFSFSSLAFFILFTIVVYFFAEKATHSPNLHTFSSVILGVIFIKMVFIILIVLVYKKLVDPNSPLFLVPFFLIYVIFTIFEVYFMSKLGRIKPPKPENSEIHE